MTRLHLPPRQLPNGPSQARPRFDKSSSRRTLRTRNRQARPHFLQPGPQAAGTQDRVTAPSESGSRWVRQDPAGNAGIVELGANRLEQAESRGLRSEDSAARRGRRSCDTPRPQLAPVSNCHPGEIHAADVVYEIARCPESGNRPYAARNRMHTRWDFRGVRHAHESPLGEAIDAFVQSESEQQALEQTMCLLRWMNGDDTRTLQTDFHMSRERLRGMGGSAAWLLQTLAAAAQAQGADKAQVRFVQDLALKAQHGLPSAMATLAALRPPGVSREALMRLHHLGITSPDDLLEADPISLQEALSPALAQAFKEAIQRETVASLRRKHSGHLHAAGEVGVAPTLIEALYTATGPALEEAVRDAFITAGLHAVRLLHQPHGEEDIQVATETGTVVVSATGSQDDSKPIRWTKAEDVMGQGAGLNPVNCVCVGRPRFESLAEKNANAIAREGGDRKILLMPTDVLAEAVIRCSRGDMTTVEFGDLVATRKGVLTVDDLPSHTGAEEPVV